MKILVAYDGSEPSRKALDKAIEMARCSGAELALLTVTESVCPLGVTEHECGLMDDILRRQTEEILGSIKKDLEVRSVAVKTMVRRGAPAEEIVRAAREESADMIVVGSHGRHGASKLLLGSVSSRVSSLAECSVVIIR